MSGDILHGGDVRAAALRHGGNPADWLDLSTGINPVAARVPCLDAAVWARLPEQALFDAAREAAAVFYGADSRCPPLPVPGTQSAIQLLPVLAGRDAPAAIVGPTYGEYALVFGRAGLAVDIIDAVEQVDERHRLVVVVNPNNPDGRVTQGAALLDLAGRLAAHAGLLVVDEAFADADPSQSLAGDASRTPGLVVFRSFGKFFGLAGLRLGFVIAMPGTIDRLRQLLGPWAVSGPALAIADRLMRDTEVATSLRTSIAERHKAMREVLTHGGLTVAGETSLFFLAESKRAAMLHDALCRRRILVRAFGYAPDWLRIGLAADAAADARLAAALAEIDVTAADRRLR